MEGTCAASVHNEVSQTSKKRTPFHDSLSSDLAHQRIHEQYRVKRLGIRLVKHYTRVECSNLIQK